MKPDDVLVDIAADLEKMVAAVASAVAGGRRQAVGTEGGVALDAVDVDLALPQFLVIVAESKEPPPQEKTNPLRRHPRLLLLGHERLIKMLLNQCTAEIPACRKIKEEGSGDWRSKGCFIKVFSVKIDVTIRIDAITQLRNGEAEKCHLLLDRATVGWREALWHS